MAKLLKARANSPQIPTATQAMRCTGCQNALPLRKAMPGEASIGWVCIRCGETCEAVYWAEAPREVATNALRGGHRSQVASGQQNRFDQISKVKRSATQVAKPRPTPRVQAANPSSQAMDLQALDPVALEMRTEGPPFQNTIHKRGAVAYDAEQVEVATQQMDQSCRHVEALVQSFERGKVVDGMEHEQVARTTLLQATSDLDLFVKLGVNPIGEGYPGAHSLHVAMLASAIGASMGWDQQALIDLGVGCLIHDLGMVLVPEQPFERSEVLSNDEFVEVAKHPVRTFELIADHADSIPLSSRMVAYQMHERPDGGGYPRGRPAAQIHEAAKVAAVADVYIALVSPRPHRQAMMPYYAVMYMLEETRAGRLDAVSIRGLLKTVSLFPIGSHVALSDGRIATVLRSSSTDYTRPIIQAWHPSELDAAGEIVDLTVNPELKIVKPLSHLSSATIEASAR